MLKFLKIPLNSFTRGWWSQLPPFVSRLTCLLQRWAAQVPRSGATAPVVLGQGMPFAKDTQDVKKVGTTWDGRNKVGIRVSKLGPRNIPSNPGFKDFILVIYHSIVGKKMSRTTHDIPCLGMVDTTYKNIIKMVMTGGWFTIDLLTWSKLGIGLYM